MHEQFSLYGLLAVDDSGLLPVLLVIAIIGFMIMMFISLSFLLAKYYKRCPPNRMLVIWGRTSSDDTLRVLHGGSALVLPLLQDYAYLSLEPMDVELSLSAESGAKRPGLILPRKYTVAISTAPELARTAAVRLLGLNTMEIGSRAEEIIGRALGQVIDRASGTEKGVDQEAFYRELESKISSGLQVLGLELVSMKRD